jgi:hypothetical protein
MLEFTPQPAPLWFGAMLFLLFIGAAYMGHRAVAFDQPDAYI